MAGMVLLSESSAAHWYALGIGATTHTIAATAATTTATATATTATTSTTAAGMTACDFTVHLVTERHPSSLQRHREARKEILREGSVQHRPVVHSTVFGFQCVQGFCQAGVDLRRV